MPTDNTDTRSFKRKAAMVLFELEQELGQYVASYQSAEHSEAHAIISEITSREQRNGRAISPAQLDQVIQATYLDELLSIAQELAQGGSDHHKIKSLREKCVVLDIYIVRNSLAHPNRPFLDTYWYRVAAIASDAVMDQLGFSAVRQALASAEAGLITDPPEEWYNTPAWEVPNNLPARLDHEITGLVGRNKEREALLRLIRNPRVGSVSVVAPGGVGKTALVLDLLKDLVLEPSSSEWMDGVAFISMKTEKLTADGIVNLSAAETIEDLRIEIGCAICSLFDKEFESLDWTIENFSSKRLVLFIDNLETLLRDNPKPFEEFSLGLPPLWRMLITSRLPVDGSSALPVDLLQEKSATHLAQVYASRNVVPIGEYSLFEKIAKSCFCNPLAIRLSIDLYAAGKQLPESLKIANKEIAQFSYNNLIQALSSDAIAILEALFIEGRMSRAGLIELLGLDGDQIAAAIASLARTSLIRRLTDGACEEYEINSSVRDLLLRSPRNIEVRQSLQELIARRHAVAQQIKAQQKDRGVSPLSTEYISGHLSEGLQLLNRDTNSILRSRRRPISDLAKIQQRIAESENSYGSYSEYWTMYARVLEQMQDQVGAERCYRKAVELDPESPTPRLLYGRCLSKVNKHSDAEPVLQIAIDQGWANVSKSQDVDFSGSLLSTYLYSLLHQHKHERVLEITKRWKEETDFSALYGAFRAGAYKRSMENLVEERPDDAIDLLRRSIRVMGDVIRRAGYFDVSTGQTFKIIDEIVFVLSRRQGRQDIEFVAEALNFASEHLFELIEKNRDKDRLFRTVESLSRVESKKNPFKEARWVSALRDAPVQCDEAQLEALEEDDYTIVNVCSVPAAPMGGSPNYIFARDRVGEEYFLHIQYFKDSRQRWASLATGDVLLTF